MEEWLYDEKLKGYFPKVELVARLSLFVCFCSNLIIVLSSEQLFL